MAVLCCLSLHAYANPLAIQVEPPGAVSSGHWDIFLEGEIDIGSAERLRQELARIGDAGLDVHFDSPGGSLMDGLGIGNLLRELGATTTVGKRGGRNSGIEPGVCLSACAIAFLGGTYRYVPDGSVFGVHRVATLVHSEGDFDAGQIVAAQVSGYIRDMGVDTRLFDRMASVARERIYVLGPAELRSLRVVNDGRQPAQWHSDLLSGTSSLSGVQQTAQGLEQAVFSCDHGHVIFHSVYQAGSNAALVATGNWNHSLLIDQLVLPLQAPNSIEDADGYLKASFALMPDQARRMIGASSVGHSMQGDRSDPMSLGYRIDVDSVAAGRVRQFVESCTPSS